MLLRYAGVDCQLLPEISQRILQENLNLHLYQGNHGCNKIDIRIQLSLLHFKGCAGALCPKGGWRKLIFNRNKCVFLNEYFYMH